MSVADLAAALAGVTVVDVSPPIDGDLEVFQVYERPRVEPLFGYAEAGAAANRLVMAEHAGTHIDAPFHFDPQGATMDEVAPDALLLRPYRKIDLSELHPAPGELVSAQTLRTQAERQGTLPRPGDVAIVEMGWDRHLPGGSDARPAGWWGANQPGLAPDACSWLVDAGVAAVASDTAACDLAVVDGEIHSEHGHRHAFLPRGILILEGLRGLAGVAASGLIVAVPLKIAGGTGSPVRVLLLTDACVRSY